MELITNQELVQGPQPNVFFTFSPIERLKYLAFEIRQD